MSATSWLIASWFAGWALAAVSVPSVLLARRGRPLAALSWVLATFALPPIGLPAWWLFGRTHLRSKRSRRERAEARFHQHLGEPGDGCGAPAGPGLLDVVTLPREIDRHCFPPTGGNAVRLLDGAEAAYAAWESAIAEARHHVHFLFFTVRDDETGRRFRDLLADAAGRGVEVRVVYDDVGTRLPKDFFERLTQNGGEVRSFLPLRLGSLGIALSFRNHRKMIVVDGARAFIGGLNVGDEYLRWRDLGLELRGSAVDQVQEIFADDWYFETAEALARADYFGRWAKQPLGAGARFETDVSCATVAGGPTQRINAVREMMFMAITSARKRLWITTPYFVPDSATRLALRSARYRGVDVRVVVPAKSDAWLAMRAARAFYPEFVESGVRIFEYDGMLHAKAAVIDDHLSYMGSANLDTRSFRLNFELAAFLESRELNESLSNILGEILARSEEVDPKTAHGLVDRTVDALAHLMSPLL